MKHKIEESKGKDFVPYEIIITMENKKEERELWHRLNIGPINVSANYNPNSIFGKFPYCDVFNGLWKKIDNKIRRRNEAMKTGTIVNLEWKYEDDGIRRPWNEAVEYAKSLGGGWRLPTIKELVSIVDYNRYNPACDKKLKCCSDFYWSDSTTVDYPDYAWGVDFGSGLVFWKHKSSNYYVRCVRDI
jgi:hypothetical protein